MNLFLSMNSILTQNVNKLFTILNGFILGIGDIALHVSTIIPNHCKNIFS